MAEPRELPAPSIVADLCAQEAWRQAANEDTRRVLELACDTIRAVMRRCVTLARRNETAEADDPDSSMMPASVEWEFDICEGDVTMYSRSPSPSMLRFSTASSGTATNAILDDLPKSFSLPSGELQSTDQPILPVRVIREAVVNAVMHRSYRIQGAPTQIIRYANRLEIRNPGHSLKSIDHLGQPGSDTRNPKIAAVLHEVNIAETKGSGIRVMRELMQESNLLPPTMESSRHPDQFVATFLFHHFLGPDDVAWLGNLTAEQLTDEESRVLVFVREVGAIDNATYREINKTETLDASVHLRRLRDLKLLEKKGSGSRTYYVPGEAFVLVPRTGAAGQATKSREAGAQSRELEEQSREPGPESREREAQSREPAADRGSRVGAEVNRDDTDVPEYRGGIVTYRTLSIPAVTWYPAAADAVEVRALGRWLIQIADWLEGLK